MGIKMEIKEGTLVMVEPEDDWEGISRFGLVSGLWPAQGDPDLFQVDCGARNVIESGVLEPRVLEAIPRDRMIPLAQADGAKSLEEALNTHILRVLIHMWSLIKANTLVFSRHLEKHRALSL